jgi:hypothetical protein
MKSPDYKYPIAQCDVPLARHSQLESYRAKRRQWLTWLDADEHHAIWTNLSSMVWTDVSYRTLRQLVIGQEDRNETGCLHNTLNRRADHSGLCGKTGAGDQAATGQDIRRYFPTPPHHRHAQ